MTNDKSDSAISAGSSASSSGQDSNYQRSLSESEFFSSRSKRPRYEQMTGNMYPAETKKYHRLIEKRRRDRINECIYQLKGLLPTDIIKSTSKPMEKAVILELVVEYMQSIAPQKNGKSREYMKGYKASVEKIVSFLNTTIDENQKEALKKCIENDLIENENGKSSQQSDIPKCVLSVPSSGSNTDGSQVCGIPKPGRAFYTRFNRNTDVQSTSSSSLGSSSPVSDISICADNSDSSGCYEMNNQPYSGKRKMYQRHHKQSGSVPHTSSRPNTGTTNQAPMMMNMPFMFAPNMMPTAQFINSDGTAMTMDSQMPRMVQPFQIPAPTGVMMPQMCTDTNGGQFPKFFMACGTQPRNDNQMNQMQRQTQNTQMETMVMQPTMMMPYRNQSNYVFMPTYPMMPQFQAAPTMVSVQTSQEETSGDVPSEQ